MQLHGGHTETGVVPKLPATMFKMLSSCVPLNTGSDINFIRPHPSHRRRRHCHHHTHPHHALPAPYSYTGLPLTPYQTEMALAPALFTHLTHTRVHFDATIDTIGGHEIWEAGQALLSLPFHDTA